MMKKGVKSCLIVVLAMSGLCVAGVVVMFFANICPPQGPWPMPPWCGANSQDAVGFPPLTVPTFSLPIVAPTPMVLLLDDAIVVPTDVEAIDYPDMFNNPAITSAQVVDPYCTLEQEQVAYPAEYLGGNGFPQINGAPLPTDIKRMVGIKDVWIPEPNLNDCPYSEPYEKMRQALDGTLLRVQALGADEITFTNYIAFVDFEIPELQPPAKAATGADDLRYIARQADEMGLGMTLYLNLAPGSEKVSWEIPSEEWLAILINNWEPFVLDQARIAEETGIDALMINHFDYQPGVKGFEDIYQIEMLDLLAKTREIYSGRILFMIEPVWGADLGKLDELLRSVDGFIYTPITMALRNRSDKSVSVSNLKASYLDNLNSISGDFGRFDQPFLLRILIQSETDFLENGWNEDMFCLPKDGDPCYQKNLDVNFSLQAVAYEALLEAIAQTAGNNTMVIDGLDANGYWFTDVILPFNSQPQFAQTIRNKPAEAVVFQWFKR